MAKVVQNTISVRPDFQVKRGAVKVESGLTTQKHAKAIFDAAGTDSSGASNKTVAAHGLGVFLPAKAVITRAWYQLITDFDSAAHTATVAIKAEGANDLYSATLVSDAGLSTPGFYECVPDGTAAKFVQCSVERELTATVAVQALTAGKLMVHVEYVTAL